MKINTAAATTTTTTTTGNKKQQLASATDVAAGEASGHTLDGCQPLFLFVKNMVVVGKQEGIDISATTATVYQHLSIK